MNFLRLNVVVILVPRLVMTESKLAAKRKSVTGRNYSTELCIEKLLKMRNGNDV